MIQMKIGTALAASPNHQMCTGQTIPANSSGESEDEDTIIDSQTNSYFNSGTVTLTPARILITPAPLVHQARGWDTSLYQEPSPQTRINPLGRVVANHTDEEQHQPFGSPQTNQSPTVQQSADNITNTTPTPDLTVETAHTPTTAPDITAQYQQILPNLPYHHMSQLKKYLMLHTTGLMARS